MKKIVTLIVFLTHSLLADTCSTNSCFDVYVPNLDSAFELNGGFLYLQPSAGNLGWGAVTHCVPSVSPNWHIKTIKPRCHPGFSVDVRYIFDCSGIDTQLTYAHLNTSDSESAKVKPGKESVSPLSQTGAGWAESSVGLLTKAHAKVQFFYDVLNWDVGINVNVGPTTRLRFFSGISAAYIKESLNAHFKHSAGLPKISLNNTSSYTGVGPRVGFSSKFRILNNFNFLSELGASLLLGSQKPAEYRFKGSSSALEALGIKANKEKISSSCVFQTVPSLDIKLGLQYILRLCQWIPIRFEAGYRSATYFNVLSGYEAGTHVLPLELGSLSASSMKHIESSFSVNGPYFTMSLEF